MRLWQAIIDKRRVATAHTDPQTRKYESPDGLKRF